MSKCCSTSWTIGSTTSSPQQRKEQVHMVPKTKHTVSIIDNDPAIRESLGRLLRSVNLDSARTGEALQPRYLKQIWRFPMLEPQEEYLLAKSWREHGDREAAHRLVTSPLGLVGQISLGFRGYGLP